MAKKTKIHLGYDQSAWSMKRRKWIRWTAIACIPFSNSSEHLETTTFTKEVTCGNCKRTNDFRYKSNFIRKKNMTLW